MTAATEVRERPILFSGPMVRAILEGRKTQTRRPIKPQPVLPEGLMASVREDLPGRTDGELLTGAWRAGFVDVRCRYGLPGDRLWVRETWQLFDQDRDPIPEGRFRRRAPYDGFVNGEPIRWTVCYRADGDLEHLDLGAARWRPSIHMPRWASRLTLEVTGVRVERLQEITGADIEAEGIQVPCRAGDKPGTAVPLLDVSSQPCAADYLRPSAECDWTFEELQRAYWASGWDGLYACKPELQWAADPWAWIVEFRRLEVAA